MAIPRDTWAISSRCESSHCVAVRRNEEGAVLVGDTMDGFKDTKSFSPKAWEEFIEFLTKQ